jgi:hypothetical protein
VDEVTCEAYISELEDIVEDLLFVLGLSGLDVTAEVVCDGRYSFNNFGWDRISTIASYSVEHFIYVCAHLFEEFLSYCLIHTHPRPLTPGDQERVVIHAAEKQITSTIEIMPEREKIRMFIDAIGQYAAWETNNPTAPYSAGITGVAVSVNDVHQLVTDDKYEMLNSVVSHCQNQDLLVPVPDQNRHTILYLSRLLCIRYRLPLSYGGWREKSLSQLDSWLNQGFEER